MDLKIVKDIDDLMKVYTVRGIVFVEEQQVPYTIEVDEFETDAIHVLGEIDNEPVAAGRIRPVGEVAKLERFAIRKAWRGQGYGDQLIEFMMTQASQFGFNKFKLHAQLTVQSFYEKHGFKVQGEIFSEADIDHVMMVNQNF